MCDRTPVADIGKEKRKKKVRAPFEEPRPTSGALEREREKTRREKERESGRREKGQHLGRALANFEGAWWRERRERKRRETERKHTSKKAHTHTAIYRPLH